MLITTGFMVGPGLPETDGPPGAAVPRPRAPRGWARRSIYVTDAVTLPPLEASLKVLGEPADVADLPRPARAAASRADAAARARRLLAEHEPTHLVAIERPGRARAGDYLSARGQSVARVERPARRAVPRPRPRADR